MAHLINMEPGLQSLYTIALVTVSPEDHTLVTAFLDEVHHQYTCERTKVSYSLGRAGPHHVVVAGASDQTRQPVNVADIINYLLEQFPQVRAGFLLSSDGNVSHRRETRVGDVVVGIHPDRHQHGVLQLDAQKTVENNELFIQGHSGRPSLVVRAPVKELATSCGYVGWLQRLRNPRVLELVSKTFNPERQQPRIHHGLLGSSRQHLGNPALLDRLAIENSLSCFETTAATLPVHSPFLVVCGISGYYDASDGHRDFEAAAVAAAAYTICLLHLLDPEKLTSEDTLSSLFQHQRFNLDRPGFRLLRLEAGTGSLVKCEIFQAYMDDPETLIPYEALSYTWGSNDLTDRVMVDGQVLPVTANLYDAMQHLRQPEKDRILWIDAICIDQGDLRERGHQVAHMSRIYAQAERVVIWLGIGTFEVKVLMSSLRELEKHSPGSAFRHWSYDDPRWLEVWERLQSSPNQDRAVHLETQRCGLRQLAKKPWFERIWILREVGMAKTAIVGCSTGWTGAKSFALAPRLLGIEVEEHCQAVLDIMPGPSRRSSWWSQDQNLFTLLRRFRWNQATDARDRIYALLDMASDVGAREAIQANYTISEDVVARNTLSYLFEENADLVESKPRTIGDLLKSLDSFSLKLYRRGLKQIIESGLSREKIQRFLQKQGRVASIDAETIMAAMKRGLTILEVVLNAPAERLEVTKELLDVARIHGDETLRILLLGRLINNVLVTEDIYTGILQLEHDALQTLLDRRGHYEGITDIMIRLAYKEDIDLVKDTLNREAGVNLRESKINHTIIRFALSRGMTLKSLLDTHSGNVPVCEWIVGFFNFASRQRQLMQPPVHWQPLFTWQPDDTETTNKRIATVKTAKEDLAFFLENDSDEAQMTNSALRNAARRDIQPAFLTEATIFEILLNEPDDDTIAAENQFRRVLSKKGEKAIKSVLQQYGDKARTERIVIRWAATSTEFAEKGEILYHLIRMMHSNLCISKETVFEAMRGSEISLMIIRHRVGATAQITAVIFDEAARSVLDPVRKGEILQLLDKRYRTFKEYCFWDPESRLFSPLI
ncbi:hypothetical protein CP533_5014 [Ophiocordyceps camponoti-saundersi (nom. inval.)]|nr:hypothetical protein CP533_5014 [Ophiocordyceps camponoti-saundersi (nom. inval.)]